MKIGVVCEGVTDFIAIREFVGNFLEANGVEAVFSQIQPSPDNTDDGGWTRVFFWLTENAPQSRISRYLSGGIFGADLDEKSCDVLLIHMDTDILDDVCFQGHMRNQGIGFTTPASAAERVEEVKRLLAVFSRLNELNDVDVKRHVFFPAAEATESWCVASFERLTYDPESLRGQDLWGAFGSCLLRSEGVTVLPAQFGSPDKQPHRRDRFCKKHRRSTFLSPQANNFSSCASNLLGSIV